MSQVDANILAHSMGKIGNIHPMLMQSRLTLTLDDGTKVEYPSSKEYSCVVTGDAKHVGFHLCLTNVDEKLVRQAKRRGVAMEWLDTQVAALSFVYELAQPCTEPCKKCGEGRSQGKRHPAMRLVNAFDLPKELIEKLLTTGTEAWAAVAANIIQQRAITAVEGVTAQAADGSEVRVEAGSSISFCADYSNTACAACAAPFSKDATPKRCERCMQSVLFCSTKCFKAYYLGGNHKTECTPGSMFFLRHWVSLHKQPFVCILVCMHL